MSLFLALAAVLVVSWAETAASEPRVKLDTEWRHVPVDHQSPSNGAERLTPETDRPGAQRTWWDTFLGVAAFGVLGLGLTLRMGHGLSPATCGWADPMRLENGGEFWRGFARGAARVLVDVVVVGTVMIAAGLLLSALGVPVVLLAGAAVVIGALGIGAAAALHYRQRWREVRDHGIEQTFGLAAKVAFTAVADVIGVPSIIESVTGRRLLTHQPLNAAERGELLGSGLVQAGTLVFAGAKVLRLFGARRDTAVLVAAARSRGSLAGKEVGIRSGLSATPRSRVIRGAGFQPADLQGTRLVASSPADVVITAPARSILEVQEALTGRRSAVRTRVLLNIQASKAAREASRFGRYTNAKPAPAASPARYRLAGTDIEVTPRFTAKQLSDLPKFGDTVGEHLPPGVSAEDFGYLRLRPTDALTAEEIGLIKEIRQSVTPLTTDSIMQKVIPGKSIGKYLDPDDPWTTVRGFVARAQDAMDLDTVDDMVDGLGLGYMPDSGPNPYIGAESVGVIRFRAQQPGKYKVAYGGRTEQGAGRAGGTLIYPRPFLGNGFTESNGHVVPEYIIQGEIRIPDGAELYEVTRDGREILRGIFDGRTGRFMAVDH